MARQPAVTVEIIGLDTEHFRAACDVVRAQQVADIRSHTTPIQSLPECWTIEDSAWGIKVTHVSLALAAKLLTAAAGS